MSNDNHLSPTGIDALRKRFEEHSRKAQTYYMVMHKAKEIVGNDDAANAWMEEAVPAFGGKTPAALVNEGRAEAVLAYISSLKS
jgi:uncharacterized protein (DUF2384 family)